MADRTFRRSGFQTSRFYGQYKVYVDCFTPVDKAAPEMAKVQINFGPVGYGEKMKSPKIITHKVGCSLASKAAFFVLLCVSVALPQTPQRSRSGSTPNVNDSEFVPGRVLVKFKAEVDESTVSGLLRSLQARSEHQIEGIGVHVLSLPAGASEEAYVRLLGSLSEVEYAELDQIVSPQGLTPNDPYYSSEWYLPKISAPDAWSATTGSSSIVIVVIDTGVDGAHEDLSSKMVSGWNFWDATSDTRDVTGHGTLMAGATAVTSNNGLGVAAPCWGCLIMPIRVSDLNGNTMSSIIADALRWAADRGARVATVAYTVSSNATVRDAAQYFQSRGGVVTMPIGNFIGWFDSSPDNPYVLTVSASDPNDLLYGWSSTGNNVDLAAPGLVQTTVRGGGYTLSGVSGTSYSAAIVAGVAGLVLSKNPGLSGAQALSILQQSADDKGLLGWDTGFGWGRVNALRAVNMAGGSGGGDTTPPTVSITSPANGATVSGTILISANASDNQGVSKVEFYVDGVLKVTDTVSPYSFSWDTTTSSNALHTLMAKAYDAAGNTASASASVTVNNPDTTAPTVSITSPANGATVSGKITVTADASDSAGGSGLSKVEFYVDGVLKASDMTSPYGFAWDTTSASNGAHPVMAKAYDGAGNTANASISVTVSNADITPPTVSISSPANGAIVSGTVGVTANASDNAGGSGLAKVEFYVDGILRSTDTMSPYSHAWDTTTASNATHSVTAKAYDGDGNTASASISVTVNNADVTLPTVSISSPANGAIVSGTVAVGAVASDDVGITKVEFYADGMLKLTDTTSPYSFSWDTTMTPNGLHSVSAKAYDAAGNTATASISVTVSNTDTTVPTVSISSPANGATVSSTVAVSAVASDNAGVTKVEFYVDGVLKATDTTSAYSFTWDTTTVANGTHSVMAKAYDAAGNTASAAVSVTVNNQTGDTTPPTISILSPAQDSSVSGNFSVIVNATDNVGVTKVELYVDGVLRASSKRAPFTTKWSARRETSGPHTLQTRASDAAGNIGLSQVVTVNLN